MDVQVLSISIDRMIPEPAGVTSRLIGKNHLLRTDTHREPSGQCIRRTDVSVPTGFKLQTHKIVKELVPGTVPGTFTVPNESVELKSQDDSTHQSINLVIVKHCQTGRYYNTCYRPWARSCAN